MRYLLHVTSDKDNLFLLQTHVYVKNMAALCLHVSHPLCFSPTLSFTLTHMNKAWGTESFMTELAETHTKR